MVLNKIFDQGRLTCSQCKKKIQVFFFLNNEIGGQVGGGGIEHTIIRGGLHQTTWAWDHKN